MGGCHIGLLAGVGLEVEKLPSTICQDLLLGWIPSGLWPGSTRRRGLLPPLAQDTAHTTEHAHSTDHSWGTGGSPPWALRPWNRRTSPLAASPGLLPAGLIQLTGVIVHLSCRRSRLTGG